MALVVAASPAFADASAKPARPFNVSLSGGTLLSLGENTFTYRDNGKFGDLFGYQGGLALGYDFSNVFGVRLSAVFGSNASACNTVQTSAHGFYPYQYKGVNVFADALLNLTSSRQGFSPILYAGIGGAHTFGFTDPRHPWQRLSPQNTAFGFRFGFIAEYNFSPVFGLYLDLCGEAYTDNYNGLKPTTEDATHYQGYPGFPLDLRFPVSFGVIFHF